MGNKQNQVEFTLDRALRLYRQLRTQGTNSTLARISVLSRCSELLPHQRRKIDQLLQQMDAQAVQVQ